MITTDERLAVLSQRIKFKLGSDAVFHVGSQAAPYLVRTAVGNDMLFEFYVLPGEAGVTQVERYCQEVLGITTD